MKLHDIVCDFEYAEKLKELGLVKKLIFVWYTNPAPDMGGKVNCSIAINTKGNLRNGIQTYTVAELGEMLPENLGWENHVSEQFLSMEKDVDEFVCKYFDMDKSEHRDTKEANARAKLLIWLIENKHVNAGEFNNEN